MTSAESAATCQSLLSSRFSKGDQNGSPGSEPFSFFWEVTQQPFAYSKYGRGGPSVKSGK